jgi:hypothetical protein
MKFRNLILVSALAISAAGIVGCAKSEKVAEASDEVVVDTLSVEDFFAKAPQSVGDTVTVGGYCLHICKHGGTKAFLQGADSTQTLLCLATDAMGGAFAPDCPEHNLTVVGVVTENVLTKSEADAYVANMTAKAEAGHCDSESKAFGQACEWQKKLDEQIAAGGDTTLVVGYYLNAIAYGVEEK